MNALSYPQVIYCPECMSPMITRIDRIYNQPMAYHPAGECPNGGKKYFVVAQTVTANEVFCYEWVEYVRKNVMSKREIKNPLDRKGPLYCKRAIVVGAGPSLDKEKYKLQGLRKRGYQIICMMRALPCLKGVIRPDAVVQSDPTDAFNDYWKMAGKDMALIGSLQTNPETIENWPGPVYCGVPVSEAYFMTELIGYAEKMKLPQLSMFRSTVGYITVMLRIMGVAPLYMGTEGWFTKDQYYAKPYTEMGPDDDVVHEDQRYPGTGRLTTDRFLVQAQKMGDIEAYYMRNCNKLRELIIN